MYDSLLVILASCPLLTETHANLLFSARISRGFNEKAKMQPHIKNCIFAV